jgi:hypothetical protein
MSGKTKLQCLWIGLSMLNTNSANTIFHLNLMAEILSVAGMMDLCSQAHQEMYGVCLIF